MHKNGKWLTEKASESISKTGASSFKNQNNLDDKSGMCKKWRHKREESIPLTVIAYYS